MKVMASVTMHLFAVLLLALTAESAETQGKKLFAPSMKPVAGVSMLYTVKTGDTARAIASNFGMTLKELQTMNTGMGTLEMISPGDQLMVSGKKGLPVKIKPTADNSYVVQSGETGRAIADLYGLTIDQLKQLNPDKDIELLNVGDVLIVKSSTINGGVTKKPAVVPAGVTVITVKSGDTARAIAATYGLTLEELQSLNPTMGTLENLSVGQKINVKKGSGTGGATTKKMGPVEPKPMAGQTVVTVKSGDTAVSLAKKYQTTVKHLQKMNPSMGTLERLNIGDRLIVIPSRATLVSPPVRLVPGQTYTVNPGESAYGVADLYGLTLSQLADLNPDKDLSALQPGDKLIIA